MNIQIILNSIYAILILKLITQDEIIVDIYVNDIFYPPFNQEKIEEIRNYMAKVGNFEKSRVSNKSLKDN